MKKPKTISTLVTIAFLFSVLRPDLIRAQGEAPPGRPTKVFLAVLDLDLSAGIPSEVKTSLSDILREQLWKTGRFRVVDRNNMERIMKEQGFQLSDCTSKECAVKVGQLLGVEEMVTGNVTLLGKTYIISVQMTRVETGEIEKMASDRCPGCEIDQLIGSIDKVSAALAEAVGGVVTPPKPVPAKPAPAAVGSLNVYSDPSEAEVYWDGTRVGVSAIFLKDLRVGEHRLMLKKEGYVTQELAVTVKPGLNSVQVQLKQMATIMIQGVPEGAQIVLDGKAMGTAPREVQVAAGSHRVELVMAGYQSYSQDLEVMEGESRTIGYSLEALEKPRVVKAPKPKSKGGVAKGFYYTGLGLGLFSLIGANGAREQAYIDYKYGNPEDGNTFRRVKILLYSLGGLGAGTAILSYILIPPLSGRDRARLFGFSGVEIALEGLALAGLSSLMAHNERNWYESLDSSGKPDEFMRGRKNVQMQNKYMYVSYGVAGAGALIAIVSFAVMPKEKKLGDDRQHHPVFSLLPEITALPEGGAYVGARASF